MSSREHADTTLADAIAFIHRNGRLLERRLLEYFLGGDPAGVTRAVAAYRNSDGGLGHALEPDLRCSESQPLFCEIGLIALHEAHVRSPEIAVPICDFLDSIADADGLVAPILPSALEAPHAGHWTAGSLPAGLNPTASLCGLLHEQGVAHPWLVRATEACTARSLSDPPNEAHTLLCLSRLADHHPAAEARARLRDVVIERLPAASFFIADAPVTGYGLTPLHFAPTADSSWRTIFTDAQITGHLDDLLAARQDDGGWPIHFDPPGAAAVAEWRARWTLDALRSLASYGRIAR